VLAILLAAMIPKDLKPRRNDQLPQRRAGEWLAARSAAPEAVLTTREKVAYYAGGTWLRLRTRTAPDIAREYAEKHATCLAALDRELGPELPMLEDLLAAGFVVVHCEAGPEESVYILRQAPRGR
jgi:hypothetical protein